MEKPIPQEEINKILLETSKRIDENIATQNGGNKPTPKLIPENFRERLDEMSKQLKREAYNDVEKLLQKHGIEGTQRDRTLDIIDKVLDRKTPNPISNSVSQYIEAQKSKEIAPKKLPPFPDDFRKASAPIDRSKEFQQNKDEITRTKER